MNKRIANIWLILVIIMSLFIIFTGFNTEKAFLLCWYSIMYYGENILNKIRLKNYG